MLSFMGFYTPQFEGRKRLERQAKVLATHRRAVMGPYQSANRGNRLFRAPGAIGDARQRANSLIQKELLTIGVAALARQKDTDAQRAFHGCEALANNYLQHVHHFKRDLLRMLLTQPATRWRAQGLRGPATLCASQQ
jgi:hypothetical protein